MRFREPFGSLIGIALVAVAACSRPDGERRMSDRPLTGVLDPCELTIAAELADSSTLVLRYTVRNTGNQAVYLFNRLYHSFDPARGAFITDPNLVNVELRSEGVVLSKKIVPVPLHIDVEKPVIPLVTRVDAGGSFEERITVRLPVRVWTPYGPDDDVPSASSAPRHAWFELGFFSAPAAHVDRIAKVVPTVDGTGLYVYPFTTSSQRMLRVGPLPQAIPVVSARGEP
jgi:hypothetical protein